VDLCGVDFEAPLRGHNQTELQQNSWARHVNSPGVQKLSLMGNVTEAFHLVSFRALNFLAFLFGF
jgi:transcriptional regulator of nitric oxide reductase